MAKQSLPFDFSSFFGDFDPSKAMQEFYSSLGGFKLPGVDVSAVLESQRKNVEALTTANQQALEAIKEIADHQRGLLQQAMQEAGSVITELSSSAGNPQEAATKQVKIAQAAVEKALENMRDLAQMTAKANQEAYETLKKRFEESLAELRALAKG